MTAPEKRARNLIGSLTTAQLLDQWEITTTMTDPNTERMVHGRAGEKISGSVRQMVRQ